MAQAHKYKKTIENRIRKGIRNGVSISVILDGIQDIDGAPKATETLYKHYGHVIAEERLKFQEYLGSKAVERIEQGSDRILELALRSKANWNPSVKVEDVSEDADENKDAISVLSNLLKKDTPKEEEE